MKNLQHVIENLPEEPVQFIIFLALVPVYAAVALAASMVCLAIICWPFWVYLLLKGHL